MTTDRAAAWCSECMSDSHDYPNCPKDEGAPTPDLATQIREQLDAWAKPTVFVEPKPLTEKQYAALVRRFQKAQRTERPKAVGVPPSPFDRMRDALLGVVDFASPAKPFPLNDDDAAGEAVAVVLARVREIIAEKLGIEAVDD